MNKSNEIIDNTNINNLFNDFNISYLNNNEFDKSSDKIIKKRKYTNDNYKNKKKKNKLSYDNISKLNKSQIEQDSKIDDILKKLNNIENLLKNIINDNKEKKDIDKYPYIN